MQLSILDCGATLNAQTPQTEYIQNAIDKCYLSGGGEVVVPKGEFLCGGLRLRSNVTLHLLKDAKLVGSRNLNDYRAFFNQDEWNPIPENYLPEYNTATPQKRAWFNAFIVIYNEKNVSIIGGEGSVIDGQNCYNPDGEEKFRGPHCITVIQSENITFKGYTVENSSNWAHAVFTTKNILVDDVTVLAGHDGVHFTICENVTVRNCKFYTGDDCIAGCVNRNVLVEDCILNSSCNAFRFSGVHVRAYRCHAFGPGRFAWRLSLTDEEKKNGVVATPNPNRFNTLRSFFSYFIEGKHCKVEELPSDMLFADCTVENPQRFISYFVDSNHSWFNLPAQDITFRNIKATGVYVPVFLFGDTDAASAKITMENCDVQFLEERKQNAAFKMGYFHTVRLQNVTTNSTCERHIALFGDENGKIVIDGGNVQAPNDNDVFTKPEFETNYV
ncbi:MAG: hypothetical protein E7357_04210 [Clostridiales bacterium]|nr:hypothetical protein [Clostridiales bacterium]